MKEHLKEYYQQLERRHGKKAVERFLQKVREQEKRGAHETK